jgi:hypothetical protein
MSHLERIIVNPAIHLNGELGRGAIEVRNVRTYWMLTAKLMPSQPVAAQTRPKPRLGRAHWPTQAFGAAICGHVHHLLTIACS